MKDAEKLELEFYKNGSAESVLKRFVFSQAEEKLIRDAMRTAQLANPRMKLIRDADELLREVAKTRDPIVSTEKKEVSSADIANFELMKLSSAKRKEELVHKESMPSFFGFKSKYGIALVIVIAIVMMTVEYFRVKPMNDEMQRQENLMHGIVNSSSTN